MFKEDWTKTYPFILSVSNFMVLDKSHHVNQHITTSNYHSVLLAANLEEMLCNWIFANFN